MDKSEICTEFVTEKGRVTRFAEDTYREETVNRRIGEAEKHDVINAINDLNVLNDVLSSL